MGEESSIFVADSRVLVRQGIRALLREYPDLKVIDGASTVGEVLEKCRALQPDIVLLDADLPSELPEPTFISHSSAVTPSHRLPDDQVLELDGLAPLHSRRREGLVAARRIRDELPGIKVILLTSQEERFDLVYEAICAGAVGLVTMRSEVGVLVAVVRSVAMGQACITIGSLTSLLKVIGNQEPGDLDRHGPPEGSLLSEREEAVLELVSQGKTNREIAQALYISESTVRSHLHNLLDKLQLSNRVQAATYALTLKKRKKQGMAAASNGHTDSEAYALPTPGQRVSPNGTMSDRSSSVKSAPIGRSGGWSASVGSERPDPFRVTRAS